MAVTSEQEAAVCTCAGTLHIAAGGGLLQMLPFPSSRADGEYPGLCWDGWGWAGLGWAGLGGCVSVMTNDKGWPGFCSMVRVVVPQLGPALSSVAPHMTGEL